MRRELLYPEWYHYDLYSSIAKRVISGQSFALTGLPGSGRSSALRVLSFNPKLQVLHFQNLRVFFVYIDVQVVGSKKTLDYYRLIYDELATRLKDLDWHILDSEGTLYGVVKGIISLISMVLENYDRVVFVCNRFTLLGDVADSVIQQLRVIRESYKDRVIVVPILEDPNQDTNNKVGQKLHPLVTETLYMPLLVKDEMAKTLDLYGGFYSLHVTDRCKERVLSLSGGHPGLSIILLKLFCTNKDALTWDVEQLLNHRPIRYELMRIWRYLSVAERDMLMEAQNDDLNTFRESSELIVGTRLIDSDGHIAIPLLGSFINSPGAQSKGQDFKIIGGRIFVSGVEITGLSLTEYKILEYILLHQNEVVSRDEIAAIIAPKSLGAGVSNESIDQYVSRLRKKIKRSGVEGKIIKTVFGRGYTIS